MVYDHVSCLYSSLAYNRSSTELRCSRSFFLAPSILHSPPFCGGRLFQLLSNLLCYATNPLSPTFVGIRCRSLLISRELYFPSTCFPMIVRARFVGSNCLAFPVSPRIASSSYNSRSHPRSYFFPCTHSILET
jgi:hypothetical protein